MRPIDYYCRRMAPGIAAFVFLALALAAGMAPAVHGQELADRQVLTVGLPSGDVLTMDPHFSTRVGEVEIVRSIYEGLLLFPPGEMNLEKLRPGLAERWEVSPDGLTYTFHLRRGVQWHHGYGEFTSEDVVFSLNRVRDPEVGSAWREHLAGVADIEAADRYTVVVRLNAPDPFFPGRVANNNAGFIVSKKAVEELGDQIRIRPIGTGPFQLESYSPRDRVVLVGNKNYWGGTPILEQVNYVFMPDISSRFLALTAGEIQAGALPYEQEWIDRARAMGLVVDLTSPANTYHIHYNMTIPPLDDLRVRQALSYAINRDEIIAFSGPDIARPEYSPVPEGYFGHTTEGIEMYHYDPDRARELLAEAGYPDGLHLGRVYMSESDIYLPIMEVIQNQWQRVGVTMDLTVVDHATYHARIRENANSVVLYAAYRFPQTAAIYMEQFYAAPAAIGQPTAITNFSHYGVVIPGIDDLLQAAIEAGAGDLELQRPYYEEAQRRITRDAPSLTFMTRHYVMARQPYFDPGHEQKSYPLYDLEVNSRLLKH